MNLLDRSLQKADNFQRRHKYFGFAYAVIKKYGDDEAAYQGALITYYGFLSLFPLMLVAISILRLIDNAGLKDKVTSSLTHYFPVLGQQLQDNIHGLQHNGLTLVVGILFTLYGARGVADAIRHSLDRIWQIPRSKRRGFPYNTVSSIVIILLGGVGLIMSEILSGYAASLGKSTSFRVAASLVSASVLFVILLAIFRLGISQKVALRPMILSAAIAAVGTQILHGLGGYIITHQLQHLNSLYGVFALVLGIIFWIYLQAQIILYALEIGSVQSFKLWPRSLTGRSMTDADSHANKLRDT